MFKVLYAPFKGKVKEEIDRFCSNAHSALVWQSKRRVLMLSGNISDLPEQKARLEERMTVACECLNHWTSMELVKEMIRSIYYTNQMGAEIRAVERMARFRLKPFYPSFSGHGAHGADAWD